MRKIEGLYPSSSPRAVVVAKEEFAIRKLIDLASQIRRTAKLTESIEGSK